MAICEDHLKSSPQPALSPSAASTALLTAPVLSVPSGWLAAARGQGTPEGWSVLSEVTQSVKHTQDFENVA